MNLMHWVAACAQGGGACSRREPRLVYPAPVLVAASKGGAGSTWLACQRFARLTMLASSPS